ncbi:hypothetical protein SRHO_G00028830 [Serrasalmus rhombeus]
MATECKYLSAGNNGRLLAVASRVKGEMGTFNLKAALEAVIFVLQSAVRVGAAELRWKKVVTRVVDAANHVREDDFQSGPSGVRDHRAGREVQQ